MKKAPFFGAFCCALLLANAASAQDAEPKIGSWYLGGMFEQDPSGFAGVTVSLPGSTPGDGFAVRGSGYASQYVYKSGASQINGTDKGGQLTGLYQLSGDWGWADLGAGARYVNVDLSPVDPGNRRRGSLFDAALVADGGWLANPWRVDGYAEYGVDQRAYFLRGGLTHNLDDAGMWHLGVESTFQGDMYYDRKAIGALGIVDLSNGLEIRVSSGATFQRGRGDVGYVAVAFSQPF